MRKKRFGVMMAAALSVSLSVTAAFPAFAEADGDQESEALDISESALAGAKEILGDAAGKASADTVRIEIGDALQQLMSQSAGTDMSWVKSISADGVTAFGENGSIDASANVLFNDTQLFDTQMSYDAEEQKIYFAVPEWKDQPAVIDVGELTDAMKNSDSSGSGSSQGGNISAADAARLQKDAEALVGSISPEEVSDFFGRYAGTVLSHVTTTQDGESTVSAGSLSTTAKMTTVSIQPEAMDQILQGSMTTLRDDELVLKVLGSDFAADVVTMLANANSSDGSPQQITGSQIVQTYQQILDAYKDSVSGMPGFSVTYGNNEDGKLCSVQFKVLYSGMEIPVFTLTMIRDAAHNAYEFDLGEMIAGVLSGSSESMNAAAADDSADAASGAGKTGILLEGTTEGGKWNETFTVRSSGNAVFTVLLSNWDTEAFRKGMLNGNLSLNVDGTDVRFAFESTQKNSQKCTVLVNESEMVAITVDHKDADASEVRKLDRTGAVEIHSGDDMQNYMSDANLTNLLTALSDAGMPEDLVNAISGELSGQTADDAGQEAGEAA